MNHRSALDYGVLSNNHNSDSEGFHNPPLVIVNLFFFDTGAVAVRFEKSLLLITMYHSEDFTRHQETLTRTPPFANATLLLILLIYLNSEIQLLVGILFVDRTNGRLELQSNPRL